MAKLTRRTFLTNGAGLLLLGITPIGAAQGTSHFVAVRIWPASSYTRATLESSRPLQHKYFLLDNPRRLVVDIQGASLDSVVQSLPQKLSRNDPYVAGIRVGQFNPETIRVVMDLKTAVNPQVFALAPVANFKHRLVIDLYPTQAVALAQEANDPLMALLQDYTNGRIRQDGTATAQAQTSVPPVQNHAANTRRGNRKLVVMLDPGHGGEDSGAVGPSGLREKDVVLSIAREAKRELERLGHQVYMTRNEDVFIPLGVRVAKARSRKADIFISIHADAFTTPQPRGTGVYALSRGRATSAAARWLAQSQNASDQIGGIRVSGNRQVDHTLFDLVQTATINDSLRLGKSVLDEMGKINRLHKGHVDQAGFAVLKAPDIPSILVETAFISNPTEERMLASSQFRQKAARAITAGAQRYLATAVVARR
ncbi:N-acetylmuramoyl-L-alanine amidase [Eikenella sp. S3360]|uniref:N-acetylmuramoyl-L-alanine amidase n=1 Tax=Eikenella glucosivorans TaxID=2766967 RepID=A0ABS0N8C2_9NEIS|nr:N-acetylmuramoyl-L-alanine amidase [Eikenella glucosivorans]MBH5328509.1 N-acetylmuramoyl-L-alanine amidase [Eikenella glucosivorans]